MCSAGSTGKNCETLIGTCRTGFCGQNGQCRDLADNSFKCVCNDGYTGQFCETFIDACQAQPCKNDGVCESTRTDFTCKCKPGINLRIFILLIFFQFQFLPRYAAIDISIVL